MTFQHRKLKSVFDCHNQSFPIEHTLIVFGVETSKGDEPVKYQPCCFIPIHQNCWQIFLTTAKNAMGFHPDKVQCPKCRTTPEEINKKAEALLNAPEAAAGVPPPLPQFVVDDTDGGEVEEVDPVGPILHTEPVDSEPADSDTSIMGLCALTTQSNTVHPCDPDNLVEGPWTPNANKQIIVVFQFRCVVLMSKSASGRGDISRMHACRQHVFVFTRLCSRAREVVVLSVFMLFAFRSSNLDSLQSGF